MRFKLQPILAIVSLGIATAGLVMVPHLAESSEFVYGRRDGLMNRQVPMHSSPGMNDSMPMRSGSMMHPMQISNEFDFLSQMIPHHEEAIATAQRVLQYSDRPEMKAFAQDIIEVQSAEIEQMQAWLNEWYPGQESNLTYSPMMRDLSQLEGDQLDRAFLHDMIMHHMDAVMMSQMLIRHGLVEHEPIRPFAQNIADSQRQEIWQMRAWLRDWYGLAGMSGGMQGGQWGGCMNAPRSGD